MEEIRKIDIDYTKALFNKALEIPNNENINKFTELIDLEEKINNCLENDTKTKIELGGYLKEIKEKELFSLENYSSFESFCEIKVGISNKYALRLIQLDEFIKSRAGATIDFYKFTISQLQEMLTLNEDQLKQCSPEMTKLKIRALKQNNDTSEEHSEDCDCEECNIHLHNIKQCKNTLHDFNIDNRTYNYDYFTTFNKQDLSYIAWLLYDELNRQRNKKVKVV